MDLLEDVVDRVVVEVVVKVLEASVVVVVLIVVPDICKLLSEEEKINKRDESKSVFFLIHKLHLARFRILDHDHVTF